MAMGQKYRVPKNPTLAVRKNVSHPPTPVGLASPFDRWAQKKGVGPLPGKPLHLSKRKIDRESKGQRYKSFHSPAISSRRKWKATVGCARRFFLKNGSYVALGQKENP